MRIILTVGQRADITQAEDLIADYEMDALLADRGYDADFLVNSLVLAGVEVVIPSKKNRLEERIIDKNLYKDRNKVERFFNKLKGNGSIMLNAKEKLIDEQPNHRVMNHHRLRETDCLPSQPFDARAQRQVLALQTL